MGNGDGHARRRPLSSSGFGSPTSLWCSSPGNCTVGGEYFPAGPDGLQPMQAYVISEVRGAWGMPQPIRGLSAPDNWFPFTPLAGISCTSAGNCLAAGTGEPAGYSLRAPPAWRASVAREVNGAWGAAVPIPGLAELSHGDLSVITQLSCGQTGWCVLVGGLWPAHQSAGFPGMPFVASEHDGAWRPAQLIPGLATSRGSAPSIGPLACDPQGSCTLAGAQPGTGSFVMTEANGEWSRPQQINGYIGALSCSSPGNCSGVGNYYPPQYSHEWYGLIPRMITETNGKWGRAAPLPGTVKFQAVTPACNCAFATDVVTGLFCTAPGQCVLVGYYGSLFNGEYSGVNAAVPFIASQVNGTWHAPREIPGPGVHGHAGIVEITALSCGSAGNCVAGGLYTYERVNLNTSDGTIYPQAFVTTETNGVWGPAEEVPGLLALGPMRSGIDFISCAAAGRGHGSTAGRPPNSSGPCTALGEYYKKTRSAEPGAFGLFTTSQS